MNIPFFPNTGDGTHCFQAVLMMALSVLMSDREFSYEYLDKISKKEKGMWTWPTAAMVWMIENGLSVRLIEEFDYREFASKGYKYLIEKYGKVVAETQRQNSNLKKEMALARKFAGAVPLEFRTPELKDIKEELDRGHVVIVNVNSAILQGQPGYSGHFIIICSVDSSTVTLHDPGLPPSPNLKVKISDFERAWGYPNKKDKNLMSIWKD